MTSPYQGWFRKPASGGVNPLFPAENRGLTPPARRCRNRFSPAVLLRACDCKEHLPDEVAAGSL
jgi:hypothetical protein